MWKGWDTLVYMIKAKLFGHQEFHLIIPWYINNCSVILNQDGILLLRGILAVWEEIETRLLEDLEQNSKTL